MGKPDALSQRSVSWYDLPSPSLPASSHLQLPPPPLCLLCLHSASSTSTLLQLQCILAQLIQLHHAHSQTNHGSTPDPSGPGSHAKGCCLYTPSTFVLFA